MNSTKGNSGEATNIAADITPIKSKVTLEVEQDNAASAHIRQASSVDIDQEWHALPLNWACLFMICIYKMIG